MLKAMDLNELAKLLAAFKSGELETADAVDRIKNLHFEDIGFAGPAVTVFDAAEGM